MENKKVPQLRFNIIENEKLKDENWFSAPASEIFISVNDRNHPELPVLSASQELGMIYRDEGGMNIFHDVANEITYKRVKPGQFVIHLRSFQGGFAHSKVEGITSPAYTILDFKDRNKHNDLFWKYVLTSDEFIKRLELITYGIRDGRSINFSDFSTLKFHFPSYEVQQKIGAFLSHVDSLIQAKTKKLESLKAVKKSLLQKCFPKAGEKVPEMRFAGFSGDWEENKLGDFGEVCMCKRIFKEQTSLTESIPFYKIGTFGSEADAYISRDLFEYYKTHYPYPKTGTILISASGSIGRTVVYEGKEEYFQDSNIVWLEHNEKISDSFLKIFYDFVEWNGIEGTTIKRLYNSIILKQEIMVPSIDEQQKIGQFFSKYDSLIILQQKEIDNLKTIKKSLLQKMFV